MTKEAESLAGRLEALRATATPGPWAARLDHNGRTEVHAFGRGTVAAVFHTVDGRVASNADLIVEAVNGLPALLARITELEGALRRAQNWMIRVPAPGTLGCLSEIAAIGDALLQPQREGG